MRYFIVFWQYTPCIDQKHCGGFALAWPRMPSGKDVNEEVARCVPGNIPAEQIQILSMFELKDETDFRAWLGQ